MLKVVKDGLITNNYSQYNVAGSPGILGEKVSGEKNLTAGQILSIYVGASGGAGGDTIVGSGASAGGGAGGSGTNIRLNGTSIISAKGGNGGQGATTVSGGSPIPPGGIAGWGDTGFVGSNGSSGNGSGAGRFRWSWWWK